MSYLDRLRFLENPHGGSVQSIETPKRTSFDTLDTTPPGPFQKIEGAPEPGAMKQGTPLSAQDQTLVTAALDRLGEDDPQTRAEVLARCAADPDALAFWTSSDRMPDPRQDLYQKWLAGIDQPRALVTLDQHQVREAVDAGVVSRERYLQNSASKRVSAEFSWKQ